MAKRIIAHKDNASGQLDVGISAATLTIPLKSGEGALFPITYAGAATSGGSSTALNDTGIGASGIAVRDIIENVTDGSFAVVTQVNTNDIVTTPLLGGTDNTWDSADVWRVNRFVVTAIQYDTDGVTILKREKMLIDSRSSDNLTVNASGRGYDGSSAQSFLADDYIYQFAMAASFEGIYEAFKELAIQIDALTDEVDTKLDITNAQTHAVATSGSDAYVAAYSPVISAYVDGMLLTFEADVANAGTATFNGGAGAYTIKKNFNQTLATDDIKAGQKVDVRWDATNTVWQMQSQIGNVPPTGSDYNQYPFTAGEALLQGDHVGITAADTIKRYSPTAIPATFDQTADLAGTFDYNNSARAGILVSLSTSLKAFIYDDNNVGTPVAAIVRIPITPSSGAIGTLTHNNTGIGITTPLTLDAVEIGSNRVLMVASKSNAFSYQVADLSSSISLGSAASIDTSNVNEGFCEYISDSHVLFFSRDTSSASIQFYKYTASGTTLTLSSTGTVITLTGKTFTLKGVRRFGTTNYFLFLVQNDTDGTAQAIIAEYNTGSSTFSTVGAVTDFGGGQDLYNSSGAQAVMANLDDTHIMVHCPTSATNDVTFLVSRTNSTSTTPIFGTFNTYTGGTNHGYSITKGNARCAFTCAMNGTTATIKLWEVNAAGTDLIERISTTRTTAPPDLNALESNGLCAAFPVNPKRMGFIGFDGGADDIGVGTGEYTLPPSAGITAAAIANGDSGNVVTGGYCDDVSGLTAAQRYYADLAGLLTIVSDGSPDKVGCTKDATELIIKSW